MKSPDGSTDFEKNFFEFYKKSKSVNSSGRLRFLPQRRDRIVTPFILNNLREIITP